MPIRSLPWRSPLTILAILVAVAFLLLGLRGVIDPEAAAHTLGAALADPRDAALMQAAGVRNIGLALLALALVVVDARRAFGFLLAAAALIACLDFAVISAASGLPHAIQHLGYVAFLGGFAAFVLRGYLRGRKPG